MNQENWREVVLERFLRDLVCIVLVIGVMCGLTGLVAMREAKKAKARPHWATIEGN